MTNSPCEPGSGHPTDQVTMVGSRMVCQKCGITMACGECGGVHLHQPSCTGHPENPGYFLNVRISNSVGRERKRLETMLTEGIEQGKLNILSEIERLGEEEAFAVIQQ